jgi:superfamily II DNA/RNA helicase
LQPGLPACPAQAQAWPAIWAAEHVLIAAPTGSGKTLAAFLSAIDKLVRQGLEGELKDETQEARSIMRPFSQSRIIKKWVVS